MGIYTAGYCQVNQKSIYSELTDTELILGIVDSYQRDVCNLTHYSSDLLYLPTDECRLFLYPSGFYQVMSNHWNMRWFKEWCQDYRPHLLTRLESLKVFW